MKKVPLYKQRNAPIERRVEDLLKRMTLDEKIAQLWAVFKDAILVENCRENGDFSEEKARHVMAHGLGRISAILHTFDVKPGAEMANRIQKFAVENTRLGIPVLIDAEALHGCMCPGSTCYPQAIALAATWNPELLEGIAVAIGKETRARGVHQVLSPVCDIARDPRAGRTEETYGEDTRLASRMAVAFVKGVQSQRVVATPKHFAANFVADGGRDSFPIHFTERMLREVYLPPYEAVFKEAGALSVMSAYNSLDGTPCSSNKWLLTDLLRGEWGFKGIVVSDWGAVEQLHENHCVAEDELNAAAQALTAGMEVELPVAHCFKNMKEAVKRGKVSMGTLNEAVRRALRVKFWTGMFDDPYVDPVGAEKITNCGAHRQMALDAARQSMVLMKNDGILPIRKTLGTIAVIGPNAAVARLGGYAAQKVPAISPLEGIRKIVSPQTKVLSEEGCKLKGGDRTGFEAALNAARQAEVVIMVVGNNVPDGEGEFNDRSNLDLMGAQQDLIVETAKINPNLVVVLVGGSAVTMSRWLDKARGLVDAWYSGQEGGTALAEVLFGDVNPGGKLPITFPKTTGQCPLYYNTKPSGRNYDYVDLRGEQAQFAFGHGLSYTKFEYSNLNIKSTGSAKKLRVSVSCNVKNEGGQAGDEVAQLYIRDEFSKLVRPLKELKGFKRISLQPGETKTARFILSWNDLAYLGDDLKPTLEPGPIQIMVGSSSQDIIIQDRLRKYQFVIML